MSTRRVAGSSRILYWEYQGPDEWQPVWSAPHRGTWRGRIRKFVACSSCGEYAIASALSPWLGRCCAS